VQQSYEELDPVWERILEWLESQIETLPGQVNMSFDRLLQDIHGNVLF
jgi:hypothetical protein